MNMYLVVQTAVYRHKIMGVYYSIEEAQDSIEKYIGSASTDSMYTDADGHHEYEICSLVLNQPIHESSDVTTVATYESDKGGHYTWKQQA